MSLVAFLRNNWPFLLVGFLLTFLSSFGQTFFIAVFAGEIRATFNLTSGEWGTAYATGTFVSGMLMIWTGMLTDRLRVRVLAPAVLVGLSIAVLSMAIVPAAGLLPVVVFLLRFFGQGMTSHVAIVAMSRWFVAARGRALSLASLGFSVGEAFLPLMMVSLLAGARWQVLWAICALVPILMAPVIIRLLRLERSPQSMAMDSESLGMGGRHWSRPQVIQHWLFWLILPMILAPSAFSTAFFFLQVHLAEVKGWSHGSLVAMFPVFTVSGIVAMLASGVAIDRLGTTRLMPFFLLPMGLGFLVISLTGSLAATGGAMVLMGLSQGMNSTVPNAFWAEYYGTRHVGSIKALAMGAMVFGSAIGPAITGVMIDRGYPFPVQMPAITAYICFTALLVGIGVTLAKRSLPAAA